MGHACVGERRDMIRITIPRTKHVDIVLKSLFFYLHFDFSITVARFVAR